MDRDKFGQTVIVIAFVVVLALLVGNAWLVFAGPPEVPPEAPAAALLAVAWQTTGITSTTNCTAQTTQAYAYQDIYCGFNFHNNQRITVVLQSSLDNSNWATVYTFPALTTDTIATTSIFSRVVSYGRYERLRLEAMTAYLVTPTCRSVFFSNWSPAAYAEGGNP